jgi:hypothetical protein
MSIILSFRIQMGFLIDVIEDYIRNEWAALGDKQTINNNDLSLPGIFFAPDMYIRILDFTSQCCFFFEYCS